MSTKEERKNKLSYCDFCENPKAKGVQSYNCDGMIIHICEACRLWTEWKSD